jgi:hypothetical protein
LLVELQRKPGLIVTPSSDLLALSGGDIPIVAVLPAGEAIETESLTKGIKRERLESASGQFQPVIILTQHAQQQEVDGVKVTLNDMFRNFNLLEPFERIRTALKALAESDPKYR